MHIAPSKRLKNQLYRDVCVHGELFYNIMILIFVLQFKYILDLSNDSIFHFFKSIKMYL